MRSKHIGQTLNESATLAKSVLDPSPLATIATPYCTFVDIFVNKRMGNDVTLSIEMDKAIFGMSYTESISKDEANELLQHQWLGISVICVYIRYFI